MTIETIAAWLYVIMLAISPPKFAANVITYPDAVETAEARNLRYLEIAGAFAHVASTEPPVFKGKFGAPKTALLLLAVSWMESGWRRDIDLGIGPNARGSGMDSCVLQVRVGRGTTPEGWAHADLVGDRRKCATAAARLMRGSFGECRHLPVRERLAGYASGSCKSEPGIAAAVARYDVFRRWWSRFGMPREPKAPAPVELGPAPAALIAAD